MKTKPINLNENVFWGWMHPNPTSITSDKNKGAAGGIDVYLEWISKNEVDSGYIVESFCEDNWNKNTSIMETLSTYMPRWYFLEVQFCAMIYAKVFGSVFPPLATQVDQLMYIEWLLYTEPDNFRYRDHLVHMFKVAFVGDRLLANESLLEKIIDWQFGSKHFGEWCIDQNISPSNWAADDKNEEKDKKEIVRIAFFLAALFHDFGYAHKFFRDYKEKLFKVYPWLLPEADPTDINMPGTKILLQSLPSSFIREHHCWLNSQYSGFSININDNSSTHWIKHEGLNQSKINNYLIAGFFRDCLRLNHSVASAFFISDTAEKLKNAKALSEKLFVAFQLAAEACMLHDMTGKANWAHLLRKKNKHFLDCSSHEQVPLAMLLILADELSLWGRPRLETQLKDKNSILLKLEKDEDELIEIDITEEKNDSRMVIKATERIKKELDNLNLECLKSQEGNKFKILDYRISIDTIT